MWATLFPGQGSQSVGMGKFLYENFPIARELFEEASDTLKEDFKKLCFLSNKKDHQQVGDEQRSFFQNHQGKDQPDEQYIVE